MRGLASLCFAIVLLCSAQSKNVTVQADQLQLDDQISNDVSKFLKCRLCINPKDSPYCSFLLPFRGCGGLMSYYCPHVCGLCSSCPVVATPVPAVTEPSVECRDKLTACSQIPNICELAWSKLNCKATCDLCNEPTTQPCSADCRGDFNVEKCSLWYQRGFCRINSSVSNVCQESCGVCKKCSTATPPLP